MRPSTGPAAVAIGLPGLPTLLRHAGHALLTESTDAPTVATACRQADADGRPVVVVTAPPDAELTEWVRDQVSRRRRVLILTSPQLPLLGPAPADTRTLQLPATLDEIMGVLGAPPCGTPEGRMVIDAFGAPPSLAGPDAPAGDTHRPDPTPARPGDPLTPPAGTAAAGPAPAGTRDTRQPGPAASCSDEPGPCTPTVPVLPPLPDGAFAGPAAPQRVLPAPQPAPTVPAAPQEPTPPGRRPPAAADVDALEDLLAGPPPTGGPAGPRPRSAGDLCPVVVVTSSKGGVGKTTASLALAQHAGEAGLGKALVVDMNRGQGDVRKYLRLCDANAVLPTVYDAAVGASRATGRGDPAGAIIRPSRLAAARSPGLPALGFGAVLAPRDGQADPSVVTAAFYRDVIREARRTADLVVVDTQIVEAFDTGGLIDGVVVPLLAADRRAWCVHITGPALPGVHSAVERWRSWQTAGVGRDRMLVMFNLWQDGSDLDPQALAAHVDRYAEYLGVLGHDPRIFAGFAAGRIPNDVAAFGQMLDRILLRVTGAPVFAAGRFSPAQAPPDRGLLARLRERLVAR